MIEDFVEDSDSLEDLFDCEYTSIDAIINQVIVFTGWAERQTENGVRALIAYGEGYSRSAFYTDSKKLREVVANPKRNFPFRAVIKVVRYGTMTGFKFFSPQTEITQDDIDNFEFYKKNKHRRGR